jgi:hypothetical protein
MNGTFSGSPTGSGENGLAPAPKVVAKCEAAVGPRSLEEPRCSVWAEQHGQEVRGRLATVVFGKWLHRIEWQELVADFGVGEEGQLGSLWR